LAQAINTPTAQILKWRDRWQRNRDFVDGEEAVKSKGELYLPKVRVDDSGDEYKAHLQRTGFFPAAFKISQGWMGLIFRKDPTLEGSDRAKLLAGLATRDGMTLDDLSAWFVRETLITNFTGVLVDHPSRNTFPANMSAADELRLGFRPYLARYTAENILEVTRGFIGMQVGITRVRLLEDDEKQVRELLINDAGEYEVRVHRDDGNGGFAQVESYVPKQNGKALSEIPFVLLNTEDSITPTPSLLENVVGLNVQHYQLSSQLAAAIHLTQAPIAVITGYVPEKDENGNDIENEWAIEPGATWEFPSKEVKVDWHIYEPKGQELVINRMREIKDELSAVGHSILAPEKPAPEAAETQLIRRAAENAMLADFTKRLSSRLERAYSKWGQWIDGQSVRYALNLDFVPQPMAAQQATLLSTMNTANQLSLRTLHEALKQGELMPMGFDPEVEAQRLAEEQIDLPPVAPMGE